MPQSLVQIYLHLVFSTKGRRPYLQDRRLCERLHAYLVGCSKGQGCPAIQVGGVADHVHLLVRLGKLIDVAALIREVKRASSKWIKAESNLSDFRWQSGYGAFSVSPSHIKSLADYIRNQASHHCRESFQDEFRRLCRKYDIAIDERYVWD